MTAASRYPLSWPTGWTRTPSARRRRADFGRHVTSSGVRADGQRWERTDRRPLTVADAITRLSGELSRLGAREEILSTNVATRLDGLPRSGEPEPKDPGAAVYFSLKGQPRCLACDRWDRTADNIAAIAQHIDALRRIDRYGVGTMEQAFAGYAALAPTAEDWWLILGVARDASTEAIEKAYRALVMEHHPDKGGDSDTMAKINRAYDIARGVPR